MSELSNVIKRSLMSDKEKFCMKHQIEENTWEHSGGDGVEYETWYCKHCDIDWQTPMEISRFWNKSERL